MVELAATQPGFLGIDSTRGDDGFGITVSYWRSEADIQKLTDKAIKDVDEVVRAKEQELMAV